jgi:Heterokaryon incompatibility protein (HET)
MSFSPFQVRRWTCSRSSRGTLFIVTITGQSFQYSTVGSSIDISKVPVSARWLDTAREWIRRCVADHPNCRKLAARVMPKRVLNIYGAPYLYDSEGSRGIYICLSHCWGRSPNLLTTRRNIEWMKNEVPWNSLQKTIRHVTMITRTLHIGYFWVDSLCIVQDDEEDWEIESDAMTAIYENSFLTIAATDATDTGKGCLMDSPPRAKEMYQVDIPGPDLESFPIFARRSLNHTLFGLHYENNYSSTPLLGQGWAFQEHLLSVRVLQFTASEILWECNGASTCECGGLTRQGEQTKQYHTAVFGRNDVQELVGRWSSIVQRYTSLALTKESDRLPALFGIANQFLRLETLGTYYAGLWEKDFVRGLLWFNPTGVRGR